VLVGNFPTTGNPCPAAPGTPGAILVIDKTGTQVNTISGPLINGPWDSAVFDQGTSAKLFISNALTGTLVRLDLSVGGPMGVTVNRTTQIASGYKVICDSVTFIDAPTGLVYDPRQDVLYVASTADNAVFAIGDAGDTTKDRGTGIVIYRDNVHLHGPLAMIQAPNNHLIVSNNDSALINSDPNHPSELTEFTKDGQFVKQLSVDPAQGGSFGLAVATSGGAAKLAAVDDNQNILLIWTLPLRE
jgi:DNA-binding beta-propeller fold protein YncE